MNRYFAFIILTIFWSALALAGIVRVPEDQPSIQAGINAAVNGDTVLVTDSIYYENINFTGKAITVASYMIMDNDTTHRDSTIINGSQPVNPDAGSVVTFESGEDTTSILCGFTITAGTGKWYSAYSWRIGGGIYCYNSGCKIIANKIINNSVTGPAARGGGLVTMPERSTAWVILKNNQITHNTATANSIQALGGGVLLVCHARIDSNLISYNSCISNSGSNYQTFGGGIICYSVWPDPPLEITMENNTITYNSVINFSNQAISPVAFYGGVNVENCSGRMTGNEISFNEIWNYSNLDVGAVGVGVGVIPDSFLIESNIIRGNAYMQGTGDCYGGGMQLYAFGIISVINNVIEGNVATYGGGVVIANNIAYPGKAILVNNTIIDNTATYGGGIYVHASTAYVMNNIVWGNQASIGAGIHTYNSSLAVANSDVQGITPWPGTGNINSNPELVADSLSNTSLCIGRGTVFYDFGGGMMSYCPAEDMNGRMRPYPAGSNPDMGAWESKLAFPDGIEPQAIVGIPKSYELSQNYPNPFNPTTNIEFQIANFGFVSLKVYDITRREVATLVSEKLPAGKYKYDWDASNLASGVYFYELEAKEFTQTKRMLLLK
jgi:hypothetical protein